MPHANPSSMPPAATSEMTEQELDRLFDTYVQSKMVEGRFCPTPELAPKDRNDDY